ncbi:hypothetical protein NL676_037415 [Syzygium grande]|nr:hypothetical protein NL676_037415 [Syzygium grande]
MKHLFGHVKGQVNQTKKHLLGGRHQTFHGCSLPSAWISGPGEAEDDNACHGKQIRTIMTQKIKLLDLMSICRLAMPGEVYAEEMEMLLMLILMLLSRIYS